MFDNQINHCLIMLVYCSQTVSAENVEDEGLFDLREDIKDEYKRNQKQNYVSSRSKSDESGSSIVFDEPEFNGFVLMLREAFANHHSIVITPSHILLLVLQGVSTHIRKNAERLRDSLVDHDEKKALVVVDNSITGDERSDWTYFVAKICDLIAENTQIPIDITGFSETSVIDQTAINATLMDGMQEFFTYVCMTRCGIPKIYLDGELEDWEKLVDQVRSFESIDIDDEFYTNWIERVSNIVDRMRMDFEIANGSDEMPDFTSGPDTPFYEIESSEFWSSIFKWQAQRGSGGPTVSGWIVDFFPYVMTPSSKFCFRRNKTKTSEPKNITDGYKQRELADPCANRLTTTFVPNKIHPGFSDVPFIWDNMGTKYNMNLRSGFRGVVWDVEKEALIPNTYWFVSMVCE
jgi:uncharacterized protein DUF4419